MNREKACKILHIYLTDSINETVVRKQFKMLCLKYHPDKGGDSTIFIELKEAHDFLLNDLHANKFNKSNSAFDILDHFDSDDLYYYAFLLENYILSPIISHLKKFDYYELYPTLEQLFQKSLYCLDDIYVPLWHHELTLSHYKIKIIPVLPDYIDVDIDNNIHVYLTIKHTNYPITFLLGGVSFLIYQDRTIFEGRGIPSIDEKNIYNISFLSTVYFHLN
jgi:hypothetical protein